MAVVVVGVVVWVKSVDGEVGTLKVTPVGNPGGKVVFIAPVEATVDNTCNG